MPIQLPSESLPSDGDAAHKPPHTRTLAVYAGAGSSAIDVAGIAAVFNHANRLEQRTLYQVVLVAADSRVMLDYGLCLSALPWHQLEEPVDTFVLTGQAPADAALSRWLPAQLQQARRWCAVDRGLIALAELGLAQHRRVSARAGTRELLACAGAGLHIDEQALFLRDERLWSCPGGAPVVDMCLAMVEDDCGRRLANLVAHHLLVPGRRSGEQPQVSPILVAQSNGGRDRVLAQVVEWINDNLESQLGIAAIAARASMSERNFHRRFKAFTGYTPLAYITEVRLERARQLLMCDLSLKEVAHRTGFSSATVIRRALRRQGGAALDD